MRWFDVFRLFGSGEVRERAEREVQTRAGLNRRSFLKIMGVASVAVAVPKLILPEQKVFGTLPVNGVDLAAGESFSVVGVVQKVDAQNLTVNEEVRLLNEALFEKLASHDPVMAQEAIDAVNDFTRMKMREDGFYRRIMPPIQIANVELDRSVMSEPLSVPFQTLPDSLHIRGPRYRITFDRIVTPRYTRDVDELKTWATPIPPAGPNRGGDGQGWPRLDQHPGAVADAKRLTAAASNREERSFARSFWDLFRRRKKEESCTVS